MFIQVYDSNSMLLESIKAIKNFGTDINTRGTKTKEVYGVSLRILNPRARIINLSDRKFPLKGAIAEFLWYMTGNPKIEIITPFLKHWANYSDDGEKVNSNYGFCAGNQIINVIRKLEKDSDSRQAVVNLFTTDFSNYFGKDTVCTPNYQFLIRDKRLHLIVNARSRDLIRGECIDQFTFTLLQEIVANQLGIDVGFYQVNIGSLHIYEEHYDLLDMSNKTDDILGDINLFTRCQFSDFWKNLKVINKTNLEDFIGDIMKIKNISCDFFEQYIINYPEKQPIKNF